MTVSDRAVDFESVPAIGELERWIREADATFRQGRLAEGRRLLRRVLLRDPGHDRARSMLAWGYEQSGQTAEAIDVLRADGSRSPDASLQLAELLAGVGREVEAVAVVRGAADADLTPIERRRAADWMNRRGFRGEGNAWLRRSLRRGVGEGDFGVDFGGGLSADEIVGLANPFRTYVALKRRPDFSDASVGHHGTLTAALALRQNAETDAAYLGLRDSDLVAGSDPAAVALLALTAAETQRLDDAARRIVDAPAASMREPAMGLASAIVAADRGDPEVAAAALRWVLRCEGVCEDAAARWLPLVPESDAAARTALEARRAAISEIRWLTNDLAVGRADAGSLRRLASRFEQIGRPEIAAALRPDGRGRRPDRPEPRRLDDSEPFASWLTALRRTTDPPFTPGSNGGPIAPSGPEARSVTPVAGLAMRNVAADAELNFQYRNADPPVNSRFRLFEALGGGVAMVDFDRDGALDLFVAQAGGDPPGVESRESDRLFRGDLRSGVDPRGPVWVCDDVTVPAGVRGRGYAMAVTAGDINADGFEDVCVGNDGPDRWWINNGDGTFAAGGSDATAGSGMTTSLAVADLNGDALSDVVAVRYIDDEDVRRPVDDDEPIPPGPLHFRAAIDDAYLADDDGSFATVGLGGDARGSGLGVLIGDLDTRPGLEVFVANDQMPNRLWSWADGRFRDRAGATGLAVGTDGRPLACMGIASGDLDGDGRIDLHVTNYHRQWNHLFLQRDGGRYTDRAVAAGLDRLSTDVLGFGTAAADFDGDGHVDLVVANGHVEDFTDRGQPFRMPTQFLLRRGRRFVAADPTAGDFATPSLGRGVAVGDWNRDGRPDAVVTHLDRPLAAWQNEQPAGGSFVQIELVGTVSERHPVGASIRINVGGEPRSAFVTAGDGYLSRGEPMLHVALPGRDLGDGRPVDVTVRWPDGTSSQHAVASGTRSLIIEGHGEPWERTSNPEG